MSESGRGVRIGAVTIDEPGRLHWTPDAAVWVCLTHTATASYASLYYGDPEDRSRLGSSVWGE